MDLWISLGTIESLWSHCCAPARRCPLWVLVLDLFARVLRGSLSSTISRSYRALAISPP
jgi:hypothetical protein